MNATPTTNAKRVPEHTPGPWFYDPETPAICSKSIAGWSGQPVEVVNLYGAMSGDDTDADAHLIAAAPDMLEALEEISELHGEINPSNYDHDDACELNRQFCYAITTAMAAIAKARGQA